MAAAAAIAVMDDKDGKDDKMENLTKEQVLLKLAVSTSPERMEKVMFKSYKLYSADNLYQMSYVKETYCR